MKWTDNERQILRKYYNVLSIEELLLKLPRRTENSIYKQVQYLRKRGWTFERKGENRKHTT